MTRRLRRATGAAVATLLLLSAGCGGEQASQTGEALPSATAACAAPEQPQLQDGAHLIGDQEPPVPYSSTPGSSGWHVSGAAPRGVHEQPLTDPQIVSVLHEGDAVAAYDPNRISDEERDLLESMGRANPRLTVTPYRGDLPTALTLVGWGVIQRCDHVDRDSVEAFVGTVAGGLDAPH